MPRCGRRSGVDTCGNWPLPGGCGGVELGKRVVGYTATTGDRFAVIAPVSIVSGRVGCLLHGCCLGRACEQILSLDESVAERIYAQEPAANLPPEHLYDKRWAVTLVERAMERLRAEYDAAGKRPLFDGLRPALLAEGAGELYREQAARQGMSEGAVKVALHRLRLRFREAVRAEIAQTVATPAEVDEELRHLMAALSG
jgi:hypothetical protein